jgi:hypothetical protein
MDDICLSDNHFSNWLYLHTPFTESDCESGDRLIATQNLIEGSVLIFSIQHTKAESFKHLTNDHMLMLYMTYFMLQKYHLPPHLPTQFSIPFSENIDHTVLLTNFTISESGNFSAIVDDTDPSKAKWMTELYSKLQEKLEVMKLHKYILSNAAMSFVYFSIGNIIKISLTSFQNQNSFMRFSIETGINIAVNSIITPDLLNKCSKALFDGETEKCINEIPSIFKFLGEGTEELVNNAFKKMTNQPNSLVYNMASKSLSKLSKRAVTDLNSVSNSEELLKILTKALQVGICHKKVFSEFKTNPLHSLALPYCRDSVNVAVTYLSSIIKQYNHNHTDL